MGDDKKKNKNQENEDPKSADINTGDENMMEEDTAFEQSDPEGKLGGMVNYDEFYSELETDEPTSPSAQQPTSGEVTTVDEMDDDEDLGVR